MAGMRIDDVYVIPSVRVPVGEPIIDRRYHTALMHPLDLLSVQHPDPLERLEVGSRWIINRGLAQWERCAAALREAGAADRRAIQESEDRKAPAGPGRVETHLERVERIRREQNVSARTAEAVAIFEERFEQRQREGLISWT